MLRAACDSGIKLSLSPSPEYASINTGSRLALALSFSGRFGSPTPSSFITETAAPFFLIFFPFLCFLGFLSILFSISSSCQQARVSSWKHHQPAGLILNKQQTRHQTIHHNQTPPIHQNPFSISSVQPAMLRRQLPSDHLQVQRKHSGPQLKAQTMLLICILYLHYSLSIVDAGSVPVGSSGSVFTCRGLPASRNNLGTLLHAAAPDQS